MVINVVSQNKLYNIVKCEFSCKLKKTGSRALGVIPCCAAPETKFWCYNLKSLDDIFVTFNILGLLETNKISFLMSPLLKNEYILLLEVF